MTAQFIYLVDCFYNASHIRAARPDVNGRTALEFADGTLKNIALNFWNEGHNAFWGSGSIVPAHPGFVLLRYIAHDGSVERLPIVAWIIDPRAEELATRPVTVDGVSQGGGYEAVLQPGEQVVRGGDTIWDSYDAWLASMKERQADSVVHREVSGQ